jgi:4-amino-4-deoxy-L-arabinose transferase-like glycosyltransferase
VTFDKPPSPPAPLRDRTLFLFFLLLVTVCRLPSFFRSSLDWDESLYLLVADQWLHGHPPYTVVWDNKPPGIYALFAATLAAFGRSLFPIRALACVAVATSCFFVFRIGKLLEREGWLVGLGAGCLYAALTLNNGGLAANTETFFPAVSMAAVFLVLSTIGAGQTHDAGGPRGSTVRLGAAGLLFGLAVEIKYVVLFDVAAASLVLALALPWRQATKPSFAALARGLGALGVGLLVPVVGVTLLFGATGHFTEYWATNFVANRVRTIGQPFDPSMMGRALAGQLRANFPFWVAPPVLLGTLRATGKLEGNDYRSFVRAATVWFLCCLVCLFGLFRTALYEHYFLQLAPWFALLTALALVRLVVRPAPKPHARRGASRAVLALVGAVFFFQQAWPHLVEGGTQIYFRVVLGRASWPDPPSDVADYLAPRLRAADAIYVVDAEPVIYFLTGARLPTRFVFPPFLVRHRDLPNIAGVSPLDELTRIMTTRPTYVLKRARDDDPDYVPEDQAFFAVLRTFLRRDYTLERSIDGLEIYRANAPPVAPPR